RRALRRAGLGPCEFSVGVQHAAAQQPADVSQEERVGDLLLEYLEESAVLDRVEELLDIDLCHDGVSRASFDDLVEASNGLMSRAPPPEAEAMTVELWLVERFQNPGCQQLDDLVFQATNGQWPHPSLRFGNQHLTARPRAPATFADPFLELLEITLKLLLVLLFRNPVDSRGPRPIEFLKCPPEIVDGVVVHEGMHLLRRPFPSGRMYPIQSSVPFERSDFADLRGQSELSHIPCSPSLHGRYPTSSLLREHLTSV